jgi:hypothetical protein
VHRRKELLNVLREDTLPGRRGIFEFCDLRKNPLRDLHRVVEHPADSTRGFLSKQRARRSLCSPFIGEERKIKSRRGLSVKKLRRDSIVGA